MVNSAKLYSAVAIEMVEFSSVWRHQRSMLALDWSSQSVFWVPIRHYGSIVTFSWGFAVT